LNGKRTAYNIRHVFYDFNNPGMKKISTWVFGDGGLLFEVSKSDIGSSLF